MNKITATVINVTPELARTWLVANPNNRQLSAHRVKAYAHDMSCGKWELNGEPIVIDKGGHLKDGQHRLAAIAMSNKTIPMLVVTGIDESTSLFDRGRNRSTPDVLKFGGVDPEIVTNTTVSTAKLALYIAHKTNAFLTDSDVREWIEDHAESIRVVKRLCCNRAKKDGRINMATSSFYLAAIHAYECGVPETVLRDFFDIASSGLSTDISHTPAIVLRNDVISRAARFDAVKYRAKSLYMCERAIYDFYTRSPRKLTYANCNKPIYQEVALA